MDLTNLKQINDSKAEKALLDNNHQELLSSAINVSNTVLSATESLIKYLEGHTSKTQVVNQLKSINTPDALRVIPFLEKLNKTLQTHENTDLTEITSVMKGILDEAKKIPKEIPKEKEQKFVDYTKQFTSLGDAIKSVEKVVKAQKLIAEAPIVNVPQTKVNVEAPDLKPLQKNIEDVVKAVNGIVIPEYKTDNTAVEELIKKSNKLLKEIIDKPISRGGGGGSSWVAVNTAGIPMPLNLDVDGALITVGGGGGGNGAILDGVSSTIKATVLDLTTSNPLTVGIVDGTGAQITSFGGGTQYADGAARGTATGTIAMGDDGTNIQAIKANPLNVQVVGTDVGLVTNSVIHGLTTAGGGSYVDVKVNPSGALSVDASNSTLGANSGVDIGDVTINNAAGVSAVNIQDGGNSITVDGAVTTSGTVTEANSAAILTSTQLLDDTVATLGTTTYTETTTKGNIVGVVRRDADTTLVNTDNEVAPLQVNAGGQLKTAVIASALPTGAATSALQTTQDTSINTLLKPASTLAAVTTVGTVTNLSQQSGVAISIGTGVRDAGTQRVTIATNDVVPVTLTSTTVTGTVTTKETRSTTNTTATVAGSATVVTLIASNANRLGGTVYNDSSAILYVKLGATASTSDFTVTLSPLTSSIGGYFEVPFAYTGIITGVWASATGNARVGEIV